MTRRAKAPRRDAPWEKTDSMTTPRENLLRIFRHETPEWIPVAGHCDPYNQPSREGMDPSLAEALGEVRWGDEATVTLSRYLGMEIMDWYGLPVRITRRNVTVESRVEGDVTTRLWHTPAGDLREVSRVCRDASGAVSSNWTEHLIKGPRDLPALAAIFEDEVIEPDAERLDRARLRRVRSRRPSARTARQGASGASADRCSGAGGWPGCVRSHAVPGRCARR